MNKIVFVATLICLLTGCVSQKVFRYEAEAQSVEESLIDANVVILPFADKRGNDNSDSRGLSLIPLVLWSSQNYDVPEKGNWNSHDNQWWFVFGHGVAEHQAKTNKKIATWNPREEIAKATAAELTAANVFGKSYFKTNVKGSDLILQGTINNSNYYGMFYTYGLSVLSPIVWVLGAPVTVNNNTLDITFTLKNSSGTVLWEKDYVKKASTYSFIYYNKENFEYYELLKDILVEMCQDLRADLSHVTPQDVGNNSEGGMDADAEEIDMDGIDQEEEVDIDSILKDIDGNVTDEEKDALGDMLRGLDEQ